MWSQKVQESLPQLEPKIIYTPLPPVIQEPKPMTVEVKIEDRRRYCLERAIETYNLLTGNKDAVIVAAAKYFEQYLTEGEK